MPAMLVSVTAAASTAAFFALAALHLYWAVGGRWPGSDAESLARTVIGGPPGMKMAPPAACIVVAVLLTSAGLLVLAAGDLVALPLPANALRVLVLCVAGVMRLRGLVGFVDERLRPAIRGSRYARLNKRFYSPLCLGLGTLVLLATYG